MRLKEHKADILAGRMSTALAIKAYVEDIIIDWGKANIIKHVCDGRGLTTLEAIQLEKVAKTCTTINGTTPMDLPVSWRWCEINTL